MISCPKRKRIKLKGKARTERENAAMVDLGCIVCRRLGIHSPAGIHHIRKLATSKKRRFAPRIPLCPMHHQFGGYGVALHAGEKEVEWKFGSVMGMLEEVNELLGGENGPKI